MYLGLKEGTCNFWFHAPQLCETSVSCILAWKQGSCVTWVRKSRAGLWNEVVKFNDSETDLVKYVTVRIILVKYATVRLVLVKYATLRIVLVKYATLRIVLVKSVTLRIILVNCTTVRLCFSPFSKLSSLPSPNFLVTVNHSSCPEDGHSKAFVN